MLHSVFRKNDYGDPSEQRTKYFPDRTPKTQRCLLAANLFPLEWILPPHPREAVASCTRRTSNTPWPAGRRRCYPYVSCIFSLPPAYWGVPPPVWPLCSVACSID